MKFIYHKNYLEIFFDVIDAIKKGDADETFVALEKRLSKVIAVPD